MKYRKKPVVIETMQATLENISNGDLIEWLVSNDAPYHIITDAPDGARKILHTIQGAV